MFVKNTFKLLLLAAMPLMVTSCTSAPEGEAAKTGEAQEAAKAEATAEVYNVNTETSVIKWVGNKVTGSHNGTLKLSSGTLTVKGTEITSGSFIMDMNTITDTDLQPGKGKEKLEGHLKTGDFFETEKFPTGKFEVVSAKKGEGNTYELTGNLTLRDVTKSVTFKANVDVANGALKASAPQFTIDRLLWGIKYEGMKDDLINQNIGLSIELNAAK